MTRRGLDELPGFGLVKQAPPADLTGPGAGPGQQRTDRDQHVDEGRTGGGLIRAGGGLIRAGGGLIRAGGGLIRAGGGLIRAGGGLIRAGGGLIRAGGGLIRAGGGLIRAGGGLIRAGGGVDQGRRGVNEGRRGAGGESALTGAESVDDSPEAEPVLADAVTFGVGAEAVEGAAALGQVEQDPGPELADRAFDLAGVAEPGGQRLDVGVGRQRLGGVEFPAGQGGVTRVLAAGFHALTLAAGPCLAFRHCFRRELELEGSGLAGELLDPQTGSDGRQNLVGVGGLLGVE